MAQDVARSPAVFDDAWTGFARAVASLEGARQDARCIDGTIIGTGEADFTKGNQAYALRVGGKAFQLLDVPGIEGDERRYAQFVREAIAKAHLVLYVNGTNKKPEVGTATRIRSYLKRGTQVLPIINVRGSADSYEFPEDRGTLEQKMPQDALQQTEEVLRAVLRPDVLLPGTCVQGLLGFSSLAFDPASGKTSIHPERARDLGRQQANYLKVFGSAAAMRGFSQLTNIENAIRQRVNTFRADIVESNKRKTIDLLAENVAVLDETLEQHRKFMTAQEAAFGSCRFRLDKAQASFERELGLGRTRLVNAWFNKLSEDADNAVTDHFGHEDLVASRIRASFEKGKEQQAVQLRSLLEELATHLNDDIHESLTRLHKDIQRVAFQARVLARPDASVSVNYEVGTLDMESGLEGWGKATFNIGSYALAGASIGSGFPVIGTAIGAALGAALGVTMSALDIFLGKDKRMRKALAKMREHIEAMRTKALEHTRATEPQLLAPIAAEIDKVRAGEVDALQRQMTQPKDIIERQAANMRGLLKKLEDARHGEL
jgi:hypothetical protein